MAVKANRGYERRGNVAKCNAEVLAIQGEEHLPASEMDARADDVPRLEMRRVWDATTAGVELVPVIAVVPVAGGIPARLAADLSIGWREANADRAALAEA